MSIRSFPADFLWGAATAGHQVEGDNVTSDTWFLEQQQPTVFKDRSGKACNSYELWETDLDIVAGLGLNAYRFSVEWARVEPEEGRFDDAALAHYEAIVDGCLARGLKPVLTLNHFTSPHWFAARAGWLNPDAPALFARYADVVMERFGDRIAYVITFNEPDLPNMLTWHGLPDFVRDLERQTLEAAALSAGVERYRAANVVAAEDIDAIELGMVEGHRAAKAVVKERHPDLPVGLSLAIVDDVVVGDDPSVRDRKRSEVYQRWLELARDDDFIGIQNYERNWYDGQGRTDAPEGAVSHSTLHQGVVAESLAECCRYAHSVAGVPILVTEHGMSTHDDSQREAFLAPALGHLLSAVEDGVPVLGYLHWTLLDNFEWIFGYGEQFGLVEVDRETFERTPKPSAAALGEIARANGLPVVRSEAVVATDRAGRYGKQLASHLGRKAKSSWDDEAGRGTVTFGASRAELVADAAGLRMSVVAPTAEVARIEGVLGRHLVKFGARDELTAGFTREDGSAGTSYENTGGADNAGDTRNTGKTASSEERAR